MKQIAQAGVQIWFYSDGTRFEYGSLATNVVGFLHGEFAAEYRRAIAAATTESHDRLARAGFVTGGRCFGYVNVRDASGVRREINRDEAAIVQRIFEFAASGVGLTGIAKRLNDAGALCPRSQRGRPKGWAPSSVREGLRRESYRGVVTWKKTKKRDASGEARPTRRPRAEWIHTEMPELRIVSDDLWSAVQRQIQERQGRAAKPVEYSRSRYLLTGILRAGCVVPEWRSAARSLGAGAQPSCTVPPTTEKGPRSVRTPIPSPWSTGKLPSLPRFETRS